MDGNGRWAKKRHFPRIAGHRQGVKTVDKIVAQCRKLGISALTLYAFSEENWNRPTNEIGGLMNILKFYLKKELRRMQTENIRFNIIGSVDNMATPIQELLNKTIEETKENNGMVLTLALSYGSRGEILHAVKKIAKKVSSQEISLDDITSDLFNLNLYTYNLPQPDLLIRTSGEKRISNFLLWQIAYTELYFTNRLWPDFTEKDLFLAILDFQKRERRYGMVL